MGKYLELQFEFKTSELNGVLLSVAEPVGFPALSIEMHNGKVSGTPTLIEFTTYNALNTMVLFSFFFHRSGFR